MWSPSGPRIVSSPRRFLCPLANANYLAPASHFCRADVGPLWSLFLTPKSSLELKNPVDRWYSPHWQFMKKECKMSSMIKALHWSPQKRTSVAVFPAIRKRFFSHVKMIIPSWLSSYSWGPTHTTSATDFSTGDSTHPLGWNELEDSIEFPRQFPQLTR